MRTVWVTSSGIMVTLIPQLKTMWAAYGSTKILNSAEGDQLPSPMAPPMIVIPYIFWVISGKALSKIAKLVMAPVTTKCTFPYYLLIMLNISKITFFSIAFLSDILSSAPSKPVSPCISAAVSSSLQSGTEAPLYTWILVLSISAKMLRVLRVVF